MNRVRPIVMLLLLLLGLLLLVSCLSAESKTAIDLSLLAGMWEGTHEYLDYEDDATHVQVPTILIVTLRPEDKAAGPAVATLVFQYREASGAALTEETTLRYFPSESLVEYNGNWAITESADDPQEGFLRLIFTGKGDDDDRPALVRQTIERLDDVLTMRREVRYEGVTEFVTRNEYRLRQSD